MHDQKPQGPFRFSGSSSFDYSMPEHHAWRYERMPFRFYRRGRGGSRILWFLIGAGTVTWWSCHKEAHSNGRYFSHCYNPHIRPGPPPPQIASDNSVAHRQWQERLRNFNNMPPATNSPFPPPPGVQWGFGQQLQAQQWEEEKERMWALGRQAGDSVRSLPFIIFLLSDSVLQMAEMSETTLESILTTVEALRAVSFLRRAIENPYQLPLAETG